MIFISKSITNKNNFVELSYFFIDSDFARANSKITDITIQKLYTKCMYGCRLKESTITIIAILSNLLNFI